MKIILTAINAKYIHANLAVLSLKAFAAGCGADIEIREYSINQYTEDILADLYRARGDLYAFSCYIWNIGMIRDLTGLLRQVRPEVPIWLGGPEASYESEALLDACPELTGIMRGEGEGIFRDLACHYGTGTPRLKDIPGILYREAGSRDLKDNGWRAYLDMDTLPFVYQDMTDFEHKIIYYETSRGCPFNCSYCLSSADRKVRLRSLDLVERELQFFIDHRVPQVKFVDRTFNCNKAHALAIWRYIKAHDEGFTNFHFEIGADLLDEEAFEVMSDMRPGLIQLEIGVQSTCEPTIREVSRTMDLTRLKTAVARVKAGRNIHQHLDLIAGLPYEDLARFRQSFNEVFAMGPDQLQLGFLKVLKGSRMYEMAKDYGIVYRRQAPYEVMRTKWMSFDDILFLKGVEEMLEVYCNSHQFDLSLAFLLHAFPDPFALFEALAAHYEAHGIAKIQQGRIRRYDILLAFAGEQAGVDTEALKALMLFDLYVRENLKSRPAWAPICRPTPEEADAFFHEAGHLEACLPAYTEAGYTVRQIRRMTHLETFPFDPYEAAASGTRKGGPVTYLFDYMARDPLTYGARHMKVDF